MISVTILFENSFFVQSHVVRLLLYKASGSVVSIELCSHKINRYKCIMISLPYLHTQRKYHFIVYDFVLVIMQYQASTYQYVNLVYGILIVTTQCRLYHQTLFEHGTSNTKGQAMQDHVLVQAIKVILERFQLVLWLAVPEIMVGHWTISYHFQLLSDQTSFVWTLCLHKTLQ